MVADVEMMLKDGENKTTVNWMAVVCVCVSPETLGRSQVVWLLLLFSPCGPQQFGADFKYSVGVNVWPPGFQTI